MSIRRIGLALTTLATAVAGAAMFSSGSFLNLSLGLNLRSNEISEGSITFNDYSKTVKKTFHNSYKYITPGYTSKGKVVYLVNETDVNFTPSSSDGIAKFEGMYETHDIPNSIYFTEDSDGNIPFRYQNIISVSTISSRSITLTVETSLTGEDFTAIGTFESTNTGGSYNDIYSNYLKLTGKGGVYETLFTSVKLYYSCSPINIPVSISINNQLSSHKTTFNVGDTFVCENLWLDVHYIFGDTYNARPTNVVCPTDLKTEGKFDVAVYYNDLITSYKITVTSSSQKDPIVDLGLISLVSADSIQYEAKIQFFENNTGYAYFRYINAYTPKEAEYTFTYERGNLVSGTKYQILIDNIVENLLVGSRPGANLIAAKDNIFATYNSALTSVSRLDVKSVGTYTYNFYYVA